MTYWLGRVPAVSGGGQLWQSGDDRGGLVGGFVGGLEKGGWDDLELGKSLNVDFHWLKGSAFSKAHLWVFRGIPGSDSLGNEVPWC